MASEMELPRDTGWSWVVLAATMVTSFLEMGQFKAFGIFFNAYLEIFKESVTMTSLVSGIYAVTFSILAVPVSNFGTERYQCRLFVMVGGASICLGYTISSFAPNIGTLIFAQGIFTAIGSACIHPPSMIILGRYFDKRRGLANGISIAMGSLGGFVIPIFFTKMVFYFSIRGALLIQAGLLFHCTLAAAFFRPTNLTAKLYEFDKRKREKHNVYEPVNTKENLDKHNSFENEHLEMTERNTHNSKPPRLLLESPSGSKSSVAQFGSIHSLMSVSTADMRITCKEIGKNDKETKKKTMGKLIFQVMDFRILKDKLVLLFMLVFCFGSIGSCTGHIYLAPYARDRNLTSDEIAFSTAFISGSEFLFRIALGALSDANYIERYRIIQISLFVVGCILQFTSFLHEFWHFALFCAIFGTFSGTLISLYAPVCVDFVGVEKFHKAVGILMCFQGLFIAVFGLLLGFIRDVTETYLPGFHLMGACSLLASFLLLFIPCLKSSKSLPRQSETSVIKEDANLKNGLTSDESEKLRTSQ